MRTNDLFVAGDRRPTSTNAKVLYNLSYNLKLRHCYVGKWQKCCNKRFAAISDLSQYYTNIIQGDTYPGKPGLGWVDFDLGSFTLCLDFLPGLMGNWQNWLGSWARWWNIPNQCRPNRGSPGDVSPCTYRINSCTVKWPRHAICRNIRLSLYQ